MLIQDLIRLFRKQVDDLEQPLLWDDDEVLQYVVDAQDTFVRRMGGISDTSTTAIVNVAVTASTPLVAHSPYILRIRSGMLLTARRALDIVNEADLKLISVKDYGVTYKGALDDLDTGEVTCAVLGIENNKIRWYKVPAAGTTTDTFHMHVFRLPYPRITTQESVLEIDQQFHMDLLHWMKYRAYSKEDAETYDKDLADKNEQSFEKACERASKDKERQIFKPRVVQYGGL